MDGEPRLFLPFSEEEKEEGRVGQRSEETGKRIVVHTLHTSRRKS